VGRQVCAAFAERGDEVLTIARRVPRDAPGDRAVALDAAATEPAVLTEVLTDWQASVVVNAAGGWGHTDEEMTRAHVVLVDRVVRALERMPGRPRLVQLGTIHEYGPVPDGTLIDESVPPAPETGYALTKYAGSRVVLDAARRGTVDGMVLRAVNMCGPYPPPESFLGGLVARLRNALADGSTVDLTIASARRDYVDVRDAARAVVLAAHAPAAGPSGVAGRVVNIGRGEAVPMGDLVTLLLKAADFPLDRVRTRDADVTSKGGDWTRADIGLAREVLGWRPRIGLADSLRDMWTLI
jgi:nucleoside-diphosphate-sugar epimerase